MNKNILYTAAVAWALFVPQAALAVAMINIFENPEQTAPIFLSCTGCPLPPVPGFMNVLATRETIQFTYDDLNLTNPAVVPIRTEYDMPMTGPNGVRSDLFSIILTPNNSVKDVVFSSDSPSLPEIEGLGLPATCSRGAPNCVVFPAVVENGALQQLVTILDNGGAGPNPQTVFSARSDVEGVPEPSTFILLSAGLAGLGVALLRRLAF